LAGLLTVGPDFQDNRETFFFVLTLEVYNGSVHFQRLHNHIRPGS